MPTLRNDRSYKQSSLNLFRLRSRALMQLEFPTGLNKRRDTVIAYGGKKAAKKSMVCKLGARSRKREEREEKRGI